MGFQDKLQFPLQPLRDNLESQTYEQFEKDPAKYSCYEDAIAQALTDRAAGRKEPFEVVSRNRFACGRC